MRDKGYKPLTSRGEIVLARGKDKITNILGHRAGLVMSTICGLLRLNKHLYLDLNNLEILASSDRTLPESLRTSSGK
jgi:hypothetical protein